MARNRWETAQADLPAPPDSVAQLVEQWPFKPLAAGSNPARVTNGRPVPSRVHLLHGHILNGLLATGVIQGIEL